MKLCMFKIKKIFSLDTCKLFKQLYHKQYDPYHNMVTTFQLTTTEFVCNKFLSLYFEVFFLILLLYQANCVNMFANYLVYQCTKIFKFKYPEKENYVNLSISKFKYPERENYVNSSISICSTHRLQNLQQCMRGTGSIKWVERRVHVQKQDTKEGLRDATTLTRLGLLAKHFGTNCVHIYVCMCVCVYMCVYVFVI